MAETRSYSREVAYGGITLAVILVIVATLIATYAQVFTPIVRATVLSDRSGLLLDPKADVTLRGVVVGQVRDVIPQNGGAKIDVAIKPDQTDLIDSAVTAQIVAPTVFGAKYVDLVQPSKRTAPIAEGDVIDAPTVGTEANQTFDNLMGLLTSINPAQLNATLGTLSKTLAGRGDQFGNFFSQVNDYFKKFNPNLPTLQRDISGTADVAGVYADAAPDILRVIGNGSVLSQTLTSHNAQLDALFLTFTRAANNGNKLLNDNEQGLISSLSTLRPTTRLLAQYSPIFPCLLSGLNLERRLVETTFSNGQPGVEILASFMQGNDGYQFADDLPKVGAKNAPNCYGAPQNRAQTLTNGYVRLDDGTSDRAVQNIKQEGLRPVAPPLAEVLFGPGIRGQ